MAETGLSVHVYCRQCQTQVWLLINIGLTTITGSSGQSQNWLIVYRVPGEVDFVLEFFTKISQNLHITSSQNCRRCNCSCMHGVKCYYVTWLVRAVSQPTARYIIARGFVLPVAVCGGNIRCQTNGLCVSVSLLCWASLPGTLNTYTASYCIDRMDNSKIGDRSFIRPDRSPIYVDQRRFGTSSKIGAFSNCPASY